MADVVMVTKVEDDGRRCHGDSTKDSDGQHRHGAMADRQRWWPMLKIRSQGVRGGHCWKVTTWPPKDGSQRRRLRVSEGRQPWRLCDSSDS